MISAVRDRGDVSQAAECLLSLLGIERPTPEQNAGAHLIAYHFADTHLIARFHTKDG